MTSPETPAATDPVDGATLHDLVEAARDGDPAAWREIIARFESLVRRTAFRYRVAPGDVEDVTQIVWLRLVEHLDRLRDPRALPGWVAVTAAHECARVRDKAGRCLSVDPTDFAYADRAAPAGLGAEEPGEALLRAEERSAVCAGLDQLPERTQQLLRLTVQEPRLSYADIGRQLDMPHGSIGPTRARSLKKLAATADVRQIVAA